MFVTYSPFKHPLQLDRASTTWRAVEVMLHVPWYVATVDDRHEPVQRTFLLASNDEVLAFAEQAPLGRLLSLQLVMSPRWSPTGDWLVLPIERVDRQLESIDGVKPTAVVTATDGRMYGGFPVSPVDSQAVRGVPLLDLTRGAPRALHARKPRKGSGVK